MVFCLDFKVFQALQKATLKRTSHKDVRKYPMKSRLRVPNEENPSWTQVRDGFSFYFTLQNLRRRNQRISLVKNTPRLINYDCTLGGICHSCL